MTQASTTDDIVIVADLFALARSEMYKDIDSFRAAAYERWPVAGKEKVDSCIQQLTDRLWEVDYWDFKTEYLRTRRRKRKAPMASQISKG